jgi:hypothetical protein
VTPPLIAGLGNKDGDDCRRTYALIVTVEQSGTLSVSPERIRRGSQDPVRGGRSDRGHRRPRRSPSLLATALAAQARIRAERTAATGDQGSLARGRDAADAALRLATRHHLAWNELEALRAHARLDEAEGTDLGWASQATALRRQLIPETLDPDPLATVKSTVSVGRLAKREPGDLASQG